MNRLFLLPILLPILLAATAFAAEPPPKVRPPEPPAFHQLVESTDPAVAEAAITALRAKLDNFDLTGVNDLRNEGFKNLMKLKRYDVAAEFGLKGALLSPQDLQVVEPFLAFRYEALRLLGRNEDALATAKALYNVCSPQNTSDAILRLASALRVAHPDDKDAVSRFKAEQMTGATTQPYAGKDPLATAPPPATQATVLSTIKLDPKPFETAINNQFLESFESLTARGNLLLLSDKPKEAMDFFERAYSVCNEDRLAPATENIARCLRAQDGSIGRSNAWILSVRPTKPDSKEK